MMVAVLQCFSLNWQNCALNHYFYRVAILLLSRISKETAHLVDGDENLCTKIELGASLGKKLMERPFSEVMQPFVVVGTPPLEKRWTVQFSKADLHWTLNWSIHWDPTNQNLLITSTLLNLAFEHTHTHRTFQLVGAESTEVLPSVAAAFANSILPTAFLCKISTLWKHSPPVLVVQVEVCLNLSNVVEVSRRGVGCQSLSLSLSLCIFVVFAFGGCSCWLKSEIVA